MQKLHTMPLSIIALLALLSSSLSANDNSQIDTNGSIQTNYIALQYNNLTPDKQNPNGIVDSTKLPDFKIIDRRFRVRKCFNCDSPYYLETLIKVKNTGGLRGIGPDTRIGISAGLLFTRELDRITYIHPPQSGESVWVNLSPGPLSSWLFNHVLTEHLYGFILDINNVIAESDESNNEMSILANSELHRYYE